MITPEMIDAGADALVQAETNGLCRLGKICDPCDCMLLFRPEDIHRDFYARKHAEAVIRAAFLVVMERPPAPMVSCPERLMDGRNEIRCWLQADHEGHCI